MLLRESDVAVSFCWLKRRRGKGGCLPRENCGADVGDVLSYGCSKTDAVEMWSCFVSVIPIPLAWVLLSLRFRRLRLVLMLRSSIGETDRMLTAHTEAREVICR